MVNKAVLAIAASAVGVTALVLVSRTRAALPPPTSVLTTVSLAATTPMSIAPGGSVTFSGTVKDQGGNPMNGVIGQMQVNGVPVSGTFTTDSLGNFFATLSFASAGTYVVTAGSGNVVSSSVSVTVTPTPPPTPVLTSLALSSPSLTAQVGGSITFTITARDQNGNPMAGVSGQVTEGGTSVSGSAFTTGSNGAATVTLQFPNAGTFLMGATSGGVNSNQISVVISTAPPPAPVLTTLAVSAAPLALTAGGTSTLTIVARDQNGNPMAGVSGQVTEGGTPVAGTFLTDSTGAATVTLQFPTAGTFSVAAVSGTVTSNSVSITVTAPPSNVASVAWGYGPTSVVAGNYNQWQALVYIQPGTSEVGIQVQWYLDGVLVYSGATGQGGAPNQATAYYGNSGLAAGTHTLYFVAGGLQSLTLTITAA